MREKQNYMIIENNKKTLFNWTVAIAVNLIVLIAVMLSTELMYETNDDFSISYKIAKGYPYLGFVNYYLCRALIWIQDIFTGLNIFVLSQITSAFIAFTAILRTLLERNKDVMDNVLAIALIALFSFDHYSSIQFTKTSAILMVAGLLLVADTYIHERKAGQFFFGFALYFIGVAYRQKGMIPALSFIAVFIVVWWLLNKKEINEKKSIGKEILLAMLLIITMIVPYGIDKLSDSINSGTPELAYGRQYQAERTKITDYPALKHYNLHADEYQKEGISENDLRMIDRFVLDYDGAASLDNLRKINKINKNDISKLNAIIRAVKKLGKQLLSMTDNLSFTNMHILMLMGLALYLSLTLRPKNLAYILMIGALTVGLYLALYYMGRAMYRAFYVADASAAFWLIYVCAIAEKNDKSSHIIKRALCTILIGLCCLLLPNATDKLDASYKHISKQIIKPEVVKYYEDNSDKFFVVATTVQKQPETYLTPLAVPVLPANETNTGGWETLTPDRMDFLKENGISNPIKDLIDNPNMYFFGRYKQKEITEYINKWYGSESKGIRFEKVDEIAGIEVFRVCSFAKVDNN